MGLVVAPDEQRQVLLLDPMQGGHQLVLVALGLRADGYRQHRNGGRGPGNDDRSAPGSERVAGRHVAQLGNGGQIAGRNLVHRHLLLAPQGEKAVQLLVGVGAGVGEYGVRADGARDHLEQRDLAHIGVGKGLEDAGQHLAARLGPDLALLIAGVHHHPGAVERRRSDLANECRQAVDGDVLGRRSAQHGKDLRRRHSVRQGLLELLEVEALALEIALHQVVVGDHDALDQGVVHGVLLGFHVARYGPGRRLSALVGDGGVGQEVGDTAERGLGADGELEGSDARAEGVLQLLEGPGEVGALTIELVDEDEAGEPHLGGSLPHQLGLDLDAFDRADDEYRQVGYSQRRHGVGAEIGVAGAIQQVDLVVVPLEGGEGDRDGDVAPHLLRVEVRGRGAVLDPSFAVGHSGGEEQRLGDGGLASPSVPDQCHIADLRRGETLHGCTSLIGAAQGVS